MQNIKIKEIADELGLKSKELIKKVQHLYPNIKSFKSNVTEDEAQEIFDICLFAINSKEDISVENSNVQLLFSNKKIDIEMLQKLAWIYTVDTTDDFLIVSYNFSEHSIVKILVAGLINLDIEKYIAKNSSTKELVNLISNMNKVLDDVEFEDVEEKDPLKKLRHYIKSNKPEVVYLEGVTYNNFLKYKKEFNFIRECSKKGMKFIIGFTQISKSERMACQNFFTIKDEK